MNEISIIMHLLSRRVNLHEFGASEDELLRYLNIKGKNKHIYLKKLIIDLSNYIEPLGYYVKFNPLNFYWYLSVNSEISNMFKTNPFEGHPSLAATLFCTLTCCLKNEGYTQIQEIIKLRKKKTLSEDLKELAKKGYLLIDHKNNEIRLTPLIGYQLDLNQLFMKLALINNETTSKN
ncbi:MAG: hypothetical protein KGD73_12595 [Candidatus Lokiarchaeota archaeon]|nr:hypothetical protein [Candidatus Lokiarchaeota archaeon]